MVSHLAGDFLLQTEWQALHKYGGLGPDPERRRALFLHIVTYTATFIPALVWIGVETSVLRALLIGVVIAIPHWVQDDGRLLDAYMLKVKGLGPNSPGLRIAVDQSFHIVALLFTALLTAG